MENCYIADPMLMFYPSMTMQCNCGFAFTINVNSIFEILIYQCRFPCTPGANRKKLDLVGKKTANNFQMATQNGIAISFVGVVTKNLDPEAVKHSSQKDSTLKDSIPGNQSESNESFFRDQSVILSLEVRF